MAAHNSNLCLQQMIRNPHEQANLSINQSPFIVAPFIADSTAAICTGNAVLLSIQTVNCSAPHRRSDVH